jgi:thiamine biosynthesis lipoprotein
VSVVVSVTTDTEEISLRAPCFGGEVSVHVSGKGARRLAQEAIDELLAIDERLSRFRPDSELSDFNRDPRATVPASPMLQDLAEAVAVAGESSRGLVDGTLLDEIKRAGYVESMAIPGNSRTSSPQRAQAVPAHPAGASRERRWADLRVNRAQGTISRPAGLQIDSGGIGKGLAADRVGSRLASAPTFCVNCAGDMLIGGTAHAPRCVTIDHPFSDSPAHQLDLAAAGVATSGITRRSWLLDGSARHHLLDPATGEPAFTGIAQATALAPTAVEAETLAKAALLAGPDRAAGWLDHGGVLVSADGSVEVVEARSPLDEASLAGGLR